MEKQRVLAVVGPTASGKTALGVSLAEALNGEVISADSMQIYEGLDIATAKPLPEEMHGIPHHLIGIIPRTQAFSVAEYVELASRKIDEVAERGKLPILVGGTGLYIDSLLGGMQFGEGESNPAVRERLTKEAEQHGREEMHRRLAEKDPEAAASIHPNNLVRVIRALEVCEISGKTFTECKAQNAAHPSRYDATIIGLDYTDRNVLYERINRRVDRMVELGLLEEVRAVWEQGGGRTAAGAIGYKELIPWLEGNAELADCLDVVRQETRRYAKRQLTWFRRNVQILWIKLCENDEVFEISEKAKKMIAKS